MKGWRWPSGLGWARRGRGLSGSSQSLLPLDPRSLKVRDVMGEGRRSGRYLHLMVSWWRVLRGAVITCTAEESAPECYVPMVRPFCAGCPPAGTAFAVGSSLTPPLHAASTLQEVFSSSSSTWEGKAPAAESSPTSPCRSLTAATTSGTQRSCPGSIVPREHLSQPQLRMDWAIQGTRDNMKPTENLKKRYSMASLEEITLCSVAKGTFSG